MKKIIAAILASVSFATAIGGCSAKNEDTSDASAASGNKIEIPAPEAKTKQGFIDSIRSAFGKDIRLNEGTYTREYYALDPVKDRSKIDRYSLYSYCYEHMIGGKEECVELWDADPYHDGRDDITDECHLLNYANRNTLSISFYEYTDDKAAHEALKSDYTRQVDKNRLSEDDYYSSFSSSKIISRTSSLFFPVS